MFEYLKRHGDTSLWELPLNDVDRLIMAQLAYVDLSCAEHGMALPEAVICAMKAGGEEDATGVRFGFQRKDDYKLCLALADASRYARVQFVDFTCIYDAEAEVQFAALTVALPDETLLVAFRGTDNTLAGWKEDFNLAFLDEVPAQVLARGYVENLDLHYPQVELCGHSKGGNLALYAAVRSDAFTRARIRGAVSFDGPGLADWLVNTREFAVMQPYLRVVMPRASLVGRLFTQPRNVQLVESRTFSMLQHYPYTWKTAGAGFVVAQSATEGSLLMGDTVRALLQKLTVQEREQLVEAIYEIVEVTEAETLNDLLRGWIKSTGPVLQKLLRTDKETYKLFARVLAAVWEALIESLGERIRPDDEEEK